MKIVGEFYERGKEFTFRQFEDLFRDVKTKKDLTVYQFIEEKASGLKKAKKVGNASSFT